MDEQARQRCVESVSTLLDNRAAFLRHMQRFAAAGDYVAASKQADLVSHQDTLLSGYAWALQDALGVEGESIVAACGGLPWDPK